MQVMVMVKGSKSTEGGVTPNEQQMADIGRFNEELVKAGVMQAGGGLHPSSKGKRVQFARGKNIVIDGPFSNTTELVTGFWLWKVQSMDEAVEWVRRCPVIDEQAELEIRPVFEAMDGGQ